MARIRTIKPQFWDSATIAKLSIPARLLFIALWNFADDEGRGRCLKREIAGFAFPYDEDVDVGPLLDEIETQGLIHRYEANGRPYYHVRSWREHQAINRPTPSKLPEPPCCDSLNTHGGLTESLTESLTDDSVPRKLGNKESRKIGDKTTTTMHARAREGVVGAESSASSTQGSHPDHSPTDHSLVALHDFWASLSGKLIPSTKDLEAMRKALELPGATLTLVMDFVKGAYRRAKDNGDPPTSFRYFLPGLERELQRRKLMAEPVKQTPPDEVDPNDIWDPRSPNFMKVS